MKASLAIAAVLAFSGQLVHSQTPATPKTPPDPPELAKLRLSREKAVSEAVAPIDRKYLDALRSMRTRFMRDGKLDSLLAVDAEIALIEGKGKGEKWTSLVNMKWDKIEGCETFMRMIRENTKVIVKGKEYTSENDLVYTHAPCKVSYRFANEITAFKATACLEERSTRGGVRFIVETSEGEVFRSGVVDTRTRTADVNLTFKPTKLLILKVDPNGEEWQDWTFWLKPEVLSTTPPPATP